MALIIAAVLGSETFEKWRMQKLSERRMEQATRILMATYKARRGLAHVRDPTMWAHELTAAEENLKERNQLVGVAKDDQRRLTTART